MTAQTHLVLGGSGFVGRHVALRLAQHGHTVLIADRVAPPALPATPDGTERANIEFVQTDLHAPDWNALLSRCDVVHHYVWTTIPQTAGDAPLIDLQDNVGMTIALLEAMVRHGGKRLVFTSSGGTVYGQLQTTPVTEEHRLDPISAYGVSKVAAEKYIGYFRSRFGVDGRIARLSNPFGAGQNLQRNLGAAATFLTRAMNGEAISIWGDGTAVRDYIHIADAAEALARLGMAPLDPAKTETPVFNIGSGEGRSLNQIVQAVRTIVNRDVQVRYSEGRPFDVPVSVLDISRAKAVLGWKPALSFEAGLTRMRDDIATGHSHYSTLD